MSRRTVLYIPGLGDSYDTGRRFALKFWRLYGVHAVLIPMRWAHEDSYDDKYTRIIDAIKTAETNGEKVVLVGESAGGSMALNVFADIPSVERVITICGVNSPDIEIAPSLQRRNPAFVESVKNLTGSLSSIDVRKITTLYAIYDESVAKVYTRVPGAVARRLPGIGHLLTIALTLTIFAQIPTAIAKK